MTFAASSFKPVPPAGSTSWVLPPGMAIMALGGCFLSYMQIVDLRQTQARVLDPLFQEETRHWRDELHWDYRPSVDLIRKFVDSHSLGGYVAMEEDKPTGYGF